MALLQISVDGSIPRLHASLQALRPALVQALRQSPGPVTFLIHGYKYAPGAGQSCPFGGLLSFNGHHPSTKVVSWPRHLRPGGVMIGFGWQARGTLWGAYERAADAGAALAEVSSMIRAIAPDRPQHYFAHSLGARVALEALPHLAGEDVQSLILMAAAEYRAQAENRLDSPAGRRADVLLVTSGENDLYDCLFERLVAPGRRGDTAIGTAPLAHGRTALLDDADTLARLARLGFRIASPARRVCHWSSYLRPGVFGLYRALIRGDVSHAKLDVALRPAMRRRWSGLGLSSAPLPLAQDASL